MPKLNQTKPWAPAEYGRNEVVAIQALSDGVANDEQQRIALRWIIEEAGFAYQQSYFPGGEDGRRDTDFAEGRRFVANSIIKLIKMPMSKVDENVKAS